MTRALKADLEVRIGLGLAALGRPGYINKGRDRDLGESRSVDAMRARAEEVLDAAWDCGIRWYDAARSYGMAEKFLGDYLRGRDIKSQDVCVSSKWGYRYTADWQIDTRGQPHEVKDHSLAHLKSQVEESLETLGEFIDVYQIHSATFESGVLDNDQVLTELARLKTERGWKIGLSVSSPQQSNVIRAALKKNLFDTVQVTYNLLEQAPADILIEARRAGLDIIVKEGMANGRVLQCQPLLDAAKSLDCTPDALALAAILAQPFEPYVLSGAVTPDQIRSNVAAVDIAERLKADSSFLAQLQAACLQDSDTYWADRAALAWS